MVDFYSPCFLLVGDFLLQMRIVAKLTGTSHTIQILKIARRSLLCVYDVVGESALCYPHHEGTSFTAKRLHEENSTAPLTSRMRNDKFRMCLALILHIRDRSSKILTDSAIST